MIKATVVREPDFSYVGEKVGFDKKSYYVHPFTTIELEDGRQFNLSSGEATRDCQVGDTGLASYRFGAWRFEKDA